MPSTANEHVLVGFDTSDDAGVYKLRDDLAIVQTVDFFTPIVDDPFDFGRIAAANSLSDVYAMGGTPISALNIVAFPNERLELRILERILAGGAAIAKQAGVAILGGHTIKDDEPKYGMAVTGTIAPDRIVTNANARPGDILVLTKPLGTGILSTGLKRGTIDAAEMRDAIECMAQINQHASAAMLRANVQAATDITGYGLLGHAAEMARASENGMVIHAASVPLMPRVLELIDDGVVPGGTRDNAEQQAAFVRFGSDVPPNVRLALFDAQTSGGLLLSVAPDRVDSLLADLRKGDALDAVIGEVRAGSGINVI